MREDTLAPTPGLLSIDSIGTGTDNSNLLRATSHEFDEPRPIRDRFTAVTQSSPWNRFLAPVLPRRGHTDTVDVESDDDLAIMTEVDDLFLLTPSASSFPPEIGTSNQGIADRSKRVDATHNGVVPNDLATGNWRSKLRANFNEILVQPYVLHCRTFNDLVNNLLASNLHPCVKLALNVLSQASQIIITHARFHLSAGGLVLKMADVLKLMSVGGNLEKMILKPEAFGRLSGKVIECARLVMNQGRNSAREESKIHMIASYQDSLDLLVQQFRGTITLPDVFQHQRGSREENHITYLDKGGPDIGKSCLEGTRMDLLADLVEWIERSGSDAQPVCWLFGVASVGKSAVAHTIGQWLKDVGRLYAFINLSDSGDTVRHRKLIKLTVDVLHHWEQFLSEPPSTSHLTLGPPVIIIDALDGSGPSDSRADILHIITERLTNSPTNFRILVTSRSTSDIIEKLTGKPHICVRSMDNLSPESTERDIHLYISRRLQDQRIYVHDSELALLAKMAEGLFGWACFACDFITSADDNGSTPMDRFNTVISSSSKKSLPGLDQAYHAILKQAIPPSRKAQDQFRSMMRQVLGVFEPLPMTALNNIRLCLLKEEHRSQEGEMLIDLSSFLRGIPHLSAIRLLHTSFRDFLTDSTRNRDFVVDLTNVHRDLAISTLRIMKHELRFNMCGIQSSYTYNGDIPDLEKRIKDYISPQLSYSCRFWAKHVHESTFDKPLASELVSFFSHERVLFWLEALSLLGALESADAALIAAAKWINRNEAYKNTLSIIRDVQKFVRIFGEPISMSVPHLYLSALPLSPTNSLLVKMFASQFIRIPQVHAGANTEWPSLPRLLITHHSPVNSVAFSPNGGFIASALSDCIGVWDAETGSPIGGFLKGHAELVTSVTFSPDSQRIASGSKDGVILVWSCKTGSVIRTLRGHSDYVFSVAFSANRNYNYIVSGSKDYTVRVWDVGRGERVHVLGGHSGMVLSVAISPDGNRVVSGSSDNSIRVWDVSSKPSLVGNPIYGHDGPVSTVSFLGDSEHIVSGGADCTLRRWDVETGLQIGGALKGHTNSIRSIAFSRTSKLIASGSEDGTIRFWDTNGSPIGGALTGHDDGIRSLAFSGDGTRIVSGSSDRTTRGWQIETQRKDSGLFQGITSMAMSVAFSPNNEQIASGLEGGEIILWNARTGSQIKEPLSGHTASIMSVSFSSDGRWVASGSEDNTIRIWDLENDSKDGRSFEGHTHPVYSVTFSPCSRYIASGSADGTIRLWSVLEGSQAGAPFRGHNACVRSVVFSPDGQQIVSGSDDRTIRVWDVGTRSQLGSPFEGHTGGVRCVTISPDGQKIVSGSDDGTVRVWNVRTHSQEGDSLQGNGGPVLGIAISRDGKVVVSCMRYGTFQLWNIDEGLPIRGPLGGHTLEIYSIAISPDDKMIVTGLANRTLRVWDFQALLSSVSQPLHHDPEIPSDTSPDKLVPCHVRLSPSVHHALRDPPLVSKHITHPVWLRHDGWVVAENRLILWIPKHWQGLVWPHEPSNLLVIPNAIELDLSDMVHGTAWRSCRKSELVLARTPGGFKLRRSEITDSSMV